MRIQLTEDLFGESAGDPLLLVLFAIGLTRHRILDPDPPAPTFDAWLLGLGEPVRRVCAQVVDSSVRLEATEPAEHAVVVGGVTASDWTACPPRLTLEDAVDLMSRPYRVLLEASRADGAFLLAMATPEERSFLEDQLDREWLEFENCGGIDYLADRGGRLGAHARGRLRCSALYDSDSVEPGHPSPAAERARGACVGLHVHQLTRRAIENYLPIATLFQWALASPTRRLQLVRRRSVRAFRDLSATQRQHFPMKRGFGEGGAAGAGPLFSGLGAHVANRLARGFGSSIARSFESIVTENELRRDGGWHELRPFVVGLVKRVR